MSTSSPELLRLKVLDVGEGDTIIVILPGGTRAIVVDAVVGPKVVETLEDEGVDEVILFLTHSDDDHVKEMQYIIDNFAGEFLAFFYNRDRLKAELTSRYRKNLAYLGAATRKAAQPVSGDFNVNLNHDARFSPMFPEPVSIEVLHPSHDEQSSLIGTTTNEASGVMRIDYAISGGTTLSILLAADVQLMGISCMLNRHMANPAKLRANVLKFPHHGAWPTKYPAIKQFEGVPRKSMADFLEVVDPQYVILSVGYGNSNGHVVRDVFDAFKALKGKTGRLRRVICTEITDTCLPAGATCPAPSCAGDVEVRIGGAAHGGIEVLPRATIHSARIRSLTTIDDAGCGHLLYGGS
jgi:beta-lactamase superfamily II metal-dependent hydrolase